MQIDYLSVANVLAARSILQKSLQFSSNGMYVVSRDLVTYREYQKQTFLFVLVLIGKTNKSCTVISLIQRFFVSLFSPPLISGFLIINTMTLGKAW